MESLRGLVDRPQFAGKTSPAIVLEGVSSRWRMNVIQALATPASTKVAVEGYGTIDAAGFSLSPDQARRLAAQITEPLGPERAG